MKRVTVVFACVLAVMALPIAASAHNAGHIFLPDGTCLLIGSFQEAPLVGQDRTQLDLVPETANPPLDEYGVSFVGHNTLVGNIGTPIFPGPNCALGAPAIDSVQDASGIPASAEIAYQ
jgi:hypothetical protein